MIFNNLSASKVRNFIFGVEDGLVSTVGLLSGVAITDAPRGYIVLTGMVLIFVEGISMGVGSVLSEHSVQEFETRKEVALTKTLAGGLIMFFSYFVAGLIPLSPYMFLPGKNALVFSIIFSTIALAFLGLFSARVSGTRPMGDILKMVILGGVTILIGVAVGTLMSGMF